MIAALTLTELGINGTMLQRMAINFIKNITTLNGMSESKSLSLRGKLLITATILMLVTGSLAVFRTHNNNESGISVENPITYVSVLPISEFADSNSALILTGTLRSKSEADLRSEVPGRITGVYATVGQWLSTGSLIAEVENRTQKAQLTQALGMLQAAKAQAESTEAQLERVQNGASKEDRKIVISQTGSADANLDSALDTARNALQAAYAGTVSVVSFGSDTMMNNATSANPTLSFQTTEYSANITAQNLRINIGVILARHDVQSAYKLQQSDLTAELQLVKSELISLQEFTDSILTALSGAIPTANIPSTTIANYTHTISVARSQVLANISALTNAESVIRSSTKTLATAIQNEHKVLGQVRPEDLDVAQAAVSAANASVTSALGSYQIALAGLEKTRIRAPISGILSSFSARKGDFINTQELGRIVGNGGTEVIFNIPSNDSSTLTIGDTIIVSDNGKGTITSISNSINTFSHQLEIVAELDTNMNMPNGTIIGIKLLTNKAKQGKNSKNSILVPINSIKFTADNTTMFTVDNTKDTKKLLAIPITLGDVRGGMVEITGITIDTIVVTDARGLTDGQIVIIK